MNKPNLVPDAMEVIVEALKNHKAYYDSWVKNIKREVTDETKKFMDNSELAYFSWYSIVNIAENAATNFVNKLMKNNVSVPDEEENEPADNPHDDLRTEFLRQNRD